MSADQYRVCGGGQIKVQEISSSAQLQVERFVWELQRIAPPDFFPQK
jgi:hypothetical protein